jgi:hypothetical protein
LDYLIFHSLVAAELPDLSFIGRTRRNLGSIHASWPRPIGTLDYLIFHSFIHRLPRFRLGLPAGLVVADLIFHSSPLLDYLIFHSLDLIFHSSPGMSPWIT